MPWQSITTGWPCERKLHFEPPVSGITRTSPGAKAQLGCGLDGCRRRPGRVGESGGAVPHRRVVPEGDEVLDVRVDHLDPPAGVRQIGRHEPDHPLNLRSPGRAAATIGHVSRQRVVVVAPSVPFDAVPHAGGQYLLRLTRILEDEADLTVLVPNTPTNRAGVAEPGAPRFARVVGGGGPRTLAQPRGRPRARRARPSLAPVAARPAVAPLRRGAPPARAGPRCPAGGRHDRPRVVRVHPARWLGATAEPGRPTTRDLSRRPVPALLPGAGPPAASTGSSGAGRRRVARRHERKGVAALDEVWVFSEKDAALLGGAGHIVVVPPPLATRIEQPRADAPRTRPRCCSWPTSRARRTTPGRGGC